VRVLIACEFSGVVRDAFRERGHDAVSCDLLPTERPGPHVQGDVLDLLGDGWDLMVAHPPCTYLANSGVRWLYGGRGTVRDPERWARMEEAAGFFAALLRAPIARIAVENPVMHSYGRLAIHEAGGLAGTVQTVQPWQFGHGEVKATQLWLRGLDWLQPTDVVDGRHPRVHRLGPSPDRWRERSRTFTGLAAAMADQWGVP
jgi:hypothetical protein